jgi:deoxyribose-phosphate aldolase
MEITVTTQTTNLLPINLRPYLEHTLLKPTATQQDIEQLLKEAKDHLFLGVCVNSCWIRMVAESLLESPIIPVCVIGFPLGAMTAESKAAETAIAIRLGALEIDMVMNLGLFKGKSYDAVKADIQAVVAEAGYLPVKVIIETGLLTDEEKRTACKIAEHAGAKFVITCTGFNGGDATVADIALMRNAVSSRVSVKASGGVRTAQDAIAMINAGAARIGTGNGVGIVTDSSAPMSGY